MTTYRILGIIHERKVSRMNFFGIVREKTFAIQPIPGNLIARISGNIHERKISRIHKTIARSYLNIPLPIFTKMEVFVSWLPRILRNMNSSR